MEFWSEITCQWVGILSVLVTAVCVGTGGCFIYWFMGRYGRPPEA